jgi:hypothetical protein
MHDKLFANQQKLDRASLDQYAQELGLNMARFKASMDAKKGEAEIQADIAAGNKVGANGTPAFFINGVSLSGAQPFDGLQVAHRRGAEEGRGAGGQGDAQGQGLRAVMKNAQGRGGRRSRPPRPRPARTPTPRSGRSSR